MLVNACEIGYMATLNDFRDGDLDPHRSVEGAGVLPVAANPRDQPGPACLVVGHSSSWSCWSGSRNGRRAVPAGGAEKE